MTPTGTWAVRRAEWRRIRSRIAIVNQSVSEQAVLHRSAALTILRHRSVRPVNSLRTRWFGDCRQGASPAGTPTHQTPCMCVRDSSEPRTLKSQISMPPFVISITAEKSEFATCRPVCGSREPNIDCQCFDKKEDIFVLASAEIPPRIAAECILGHRTSCGRTISLPVRCRSRRYCGLNSRFAVPRPR